MLHAALTPHVHVHVSLYKEQYDTPRVVVVGPIQTCYGLERGQLPVKEHIK